MDSARDVSEVAATVRVAVGLLVRKMKQAPLDGELTMAEDSARLDRISPQSMGVTVAALEERGLVRRSRDPEDGRRIVLSVTETGQRMVHDKRGRRTEQIAAALRDGFSDDELGQLMTAAGLLERLAEKL
jgi:DNA-binding MarR family transcriptional regulator